MSNPSNHDLFSASLESIETGKRVEKFERFKNDFQHDYITTLDNAQEWIKAELPIVTDYIDASSVKDELKQSNTSNRRKNLLSALLFEKSLRDAVSNNNANTAAVMAMHMFSHMLQAKIELHGIEPVANPKLSSVNNTANDSTVDTYNDTHNDTREMILTTLIEKSEKLKQDSQIQSSIKSATSTTKVPVDAPARTPAQQVPTHKKRAPVKTQTANKHSSTTQNKNNLWSQEAEKESNRISSAKRKKPKHKKNGMFARVKTKIPLKRKTKLNSAAAYKENNITKNSPDDSLLDDPNRSAIHVSDGFSDSIDDSLVKARSEIFKDPNSSGVTVHKILKDREHKKQEPGSNTIIMKLASSTGKRSAGNATVPEQCQDAINLLTQQFPGYDMVAIRHMAAEKVGVSPQYIENLNILPENSA